MSGSGGQVSQESSPKTQSCPLSPESRLRIASASTAVDDSLLQLRGCSSDDDSGCVMEDVYAWVPSGVKPDIVHGYFACLPVDKVPYVNSAGEQWRLRQMNTQLPPQDSNVRYCGNLSEFEVRELEAFERARKQQCLGRGTVKQLPVSDSGHKLYCHQCKSPINAEDLAIAAPDHFDDRAFWHPRCFVCVECQDLLVDLIYFKHNENVFCGRHHAEQIKPRCANCDELIFSEECTEAEGRVWHMKHFICARCDCQLGGRQYIVRGDGQPHCVPCYNHAEAAPPSPPQPTLQPRRHCNTCHKEIPADRPHIVTQSALGNGTTPTAHYWHADERCFCCNACEKNLLGKTYSFAHGRLHCGVNGCARKVGSAASTASASSAASESLPSTPSPSATATAVTQLTSSRPSPSVSRVRFDLRHAQKRLPPKWSPPPVPKSAPSTPSENVYETVVAFPAFTTAPSTSSFNGIGQVVADESSRRALQNSPRSSVPDLPSRRPPRHAVVPPPPSQLPRATTLHSSSNSSLDEAEACERGGRWPQPPQPRCRSADGRRSKSKGRHAKHHRVSGRVVAEELEGRGSGDWDKTSEGTRRRPRNFYSKMPPSERMMLYRRRRHYAAYYSSTSSDSDSSEDDDAEAFLRDYLSVISLPRQQLPIPPVNNHSNQKEQKSNRKQNPNPKKPIATFDSPLLLPSAASYARRLQSQPKVKTAKNKANSNCIVS